MTQLAELKVGSRGRVTGIDGSDEIATRLLEMGVTPGVECRMVGSALLGDPLEIEIRGYRLSLRRAEARRVEVEVLDTDS